MTPLKEWLNSLNPPKEFIPPCKCDGIEGKVKLGNMENAWRNVIEEGAGYYDAYFCAKK